MHAIAQSSPVTDLQTRLVLQKDYDEVARGVRKQPLVGPLCEACHAPTGTQQVAFSEHSNPMIDVRARAPASEFGVSCTTCHSITALVKSDAKDSAGAGSQYLNAKNFTLRAGRRYHGPYGSGEPGDSVAVGNSEHEPLFKKFFQESDLCASCHTVVLEDREKGAKAVVLQNTFEEWRNPGDKVGVINWSKVDERAHCLSCHGVNLDKAVMVAERMQRQRIALLDRKTEMIKVIREIGETASQPTASAVIVKGVDALPPPRRRFNHAFVGVDYHLETHLPYAADHPRASRNQDIQKATILDVEKLLKISAGVYQEDECRSNALCVSVANLATGHKFPAGFAFARESWIEVAVSRSSAGDDWEVIVGGASGKELRTDARLDTSNPGLRNFQAVLFDGNSGSDTVLQNEATDVLVGTQAVKAGFKDREQFLLPGEIRRVQIAISGWPERFADRKRTRVRLLFRNFPPKFLDDLATRFDKLGGEKNSAHARRARELKRGLRIFEIARDCLPRGTDCGSKHVP